ncbi:FtsX-like permease family protein [Pelagicoccus sp. SDUM812005]|uniref:ABC transporter permease n=1 Tax=Pelagicoccus sp. SDUM812005 TaxID=3041257 RepID=UPI00280FEDFC|nr:FtsX-like permease family protein [Pelagicoccus sp. SDUM812005]MDQ8182704.1 ABC transporter permease [Pelagicoccus sp. SDUM812005]
MNLSLFASLLWRFGIRYWIRHWIKLTLLVSIVALGTGAFLAIGLANRASTQSFDQFAQTVSGQSQLVVTPSLAELSLADLRALRIALLDTEATLVPQIVASARLANRPDISPSQEIFTVIGMDLLAASNFLLRHHAESTFLNASPATEERPRGVYAQAETSRAFSWDTSSTLSLYLEDQLVELPWIGELPQLQQERQAASNVLVMDWRDLSELLSKPLHANRVDIIWTDPEPSAGEIEAALKRLQNANPGNWVIESQRQRQATGATMTLALRMNLRALSVLSLLVAICLVFQAMDSTVARRQGEVATLHSLGVSTKLTRLLWFADACLIGFLGGGLGLLFGDAMARVSTEMVGQTINTLYYNAGTISHQYSIPEAALAWFLTILFCILAGWWPARQAARAPLVETIRQGNHRSSYSRKSYWLAALAFSILSVVAYSIPPLRAENGHAIPVGGYALAITLIGLVASLASLALESMGKLCLKLGKRSPSLRLALSQFRLPVTRHRLALAGVILSVGMTASMIFLIGSFESTVRAWIGNTLQADLFIRPKSVSASHEVPGISPKIIEKLTQDPRVSDSGVIYRTSTRIQNLPTQLIGFDTDYLHRIDHTTWIKRPTNLLELKNGKTATVNEAFASRFQKGVGDSLQLPTAQGPRELRIIGVIADYGNENGSLAIDQETFKNIAGTARPSAVALHLENPEQIDAYARELREAQPALLTMTNRWLREETLRIFNRVFSITYALEAIGLLISVVGLGSMLASLLIERRSEISTLQRIGFDVQTIARSSLWEGLALASLGILAGLLLGCLLGLTLVFIINKQSFGWTLHVSIPWITLAGLSLLTLAGAGTVSYFVGRWSAKLPLQTEE